MDLRRAAKFTVQTSSQRNRLWIETKLLDFMVQPTTASSPKAAGMMEVLPESYTFKPHFNQSARALQRESSPMQACASAHTPTPTHQCKFGGEAVSCGSLLPCTEMKTWAPPFALETTIADTCVQCNRIVATTTPECIGLDRQCVCVQAIKVLSL
eukprot:1140568-Pelagomonas_calceolata.AAC.2